MSETEFEQFAKAFRCSVPMAEAIVARIRQRVGSDVPMAEILAAIKKIAPSRLTTDTIVARLQKTAANKAAKTPPAGDDDGESDPPNTSRGASRTTHPSKRSGDSGPASAQGQITSILTRNWAHAKQVGLKPPDLTVQRFIRATQSAVGEPKPTITRILAAVQKLSKKDVLITPNLVADEIIETDEM